ncbi:MAG: hypothetical protein OEW08_10975 [Gammaproteobacteria bacterium]|nr:hypothetical protein [Gammaproteobacteria bacterium]
MRNLLHVLNTAYVYSARRDNVKSLLTAVRVLPAGVDDDRLATSLTTPEADAATYAGQRARSEKGALRAPIKATEFDYLERRWQIRLRQLPMEQRNALERIVINTEKFAMDQRKHIDEMDQQAAQLSEKYREVEIRTEKELSTIDESRYALQALRRKQLIQELSEYRSR